MSMKNNVENKFTSCHELSMGTFFKHIVAGELNKARGIFEQQHPQISSQTAIRRLEDILSGQITVFEFSSDIYIIADDQQAARKCCNEAIAFLSQHELTLESTLLIDFNVALNDFAAAVTLSENAYYLCLSADTPQQLKSLAVHEIVHTIFDSKCRFLDEAAAYYYELLSNGDFPVKAKATISIIKNSFVDVRTLLAYPATDDPYFNLLLPNSPFEVHSYGALFFHELLKVLGVSKLKQLYSWLATERNELGFAAVIEKTVGRSLESFYTSLVEQNEPENEQAFDRDYDDKKIEKLFIQGDISELNSYYELIFRHSSLNKPVVNLAEVHILILSSVAISKAFKSTLGRAEHAFFVARLQQFLVDKPRDWGRFYLYLAMINLVNMSFEGSMLDAMLLLDEAKVDLDKALNINDSDAIVLTFLARLIWHSPSEVTGNKVEAVNLLRRVADIPQYTEYVQPSLDLLESEIAKEAV